MKRLARITYVAAALFAQSAFASNAVAHDQVSQAAVKAAYHDMAKEVSGQQTNNVALARLRAFASADTHQQSDAYDFEVRVERDGQPLLVSSIPGVMVRSSGYGPAPVLSMTTCSTPVQQEECRGDQYAVLAARPEMMSGALAMSLEFELRDTLRGKTPAIMESLYWKGTVKVPQGKDMAINLDGKTVIHLKAKATAM